MKETNSERILLTEIRDIDYGTSYPFYKLFDKHSIKYVDQVLNDEVMSNILIYCREENERIRLMSFISLLKFKYQSVPMAEDILLNETITNDEQGKEKFNEIFGRLGFNDRQLKPILEVILSSEEKPLIDIFIDCVKSAYFRDLKNRKDRQASKSFMSINGIMKFYIESYDKTHNVSLSTHNQIDELKIFKESIDRLIESERTLERDIKYMKEKIMVLENARDKVNREINSLRDFLDEEEKKSGGRK